jgi:LmbE family N-acetylglucosaminyl deacetylase
LIKEGLYPHKVKEVLLWGTEDANHRSDISETFHVKLAALRCHKSQVGHIPREELEKRLRERHGSLAEGENFLLAEAFHRVEILW